MQFHTSIIGRELPENGTALPIAFEFQGQDHSSQYNPEVLHALLGSKAVLTSDPLYLPPGLSLQILSSNFIERATLACSP